MHQNAFAAGALPGYRWGSLQLSPDPVAGYRRRRMEDDKKKV